MQAYFGARCSVDWNHMAARVGVRARNRLDADAIMAFGLCLAVYGLWLGAFLEAMRG